MESEVTYAFTWDEWTVGPTSSVSFSDQMRVWLRHQNGLDLSGGAGFLPDHVHRQIDHALPWFFQVSSMKFQLVVLLHHRVEIVKLAL